MNYIQYMYIMWKGHCKNFIRNYQFKVVNKAKNKTKTLVSTTGYKNRVGFKFIIFFFYFETLMKLTFHENVSKENI